MNKEPILHADQPAWYRIRLQGALDSKWSALLQEMGSVTQDDATTVLLGELLDQAALLGVLNLVYNLGFPILSVEYLETPAGVGER